LITAYAGPQTDQAVLIDFYRKVHPIGPGWRPIRIAAGISEAEAAEMVKEENIPLAMVGWVAGTTTIWAGLFCVGNFLYGRMELFYGLLALLVVSGLALIAVVKRLWH